MENEWIRECVDNYDDIPKGVLKQMCYLNKMYKDSSNFGYVYFLFNEDTGLTKIGKTKNLNSRMKNLISTFKNHIGNVPKLKLKALLFSHDIVLSELETDMHRDLKEYRKYGEWFDLQNVEQIEYLPLEDMKLVEDTWVSIVETHDFHLYKPINFEKEKMYVPSLFGKINSISYDLIEFCDKNKDIGFEVEWIALNPTRKRIITINPEAKVIYNINTLKQEFYDESEITDTLKVLT